MSKETISKIYYNARKVNSARLCRWWGVRKAHKLQKERIALLEAMSDEERLNHMQNLVNQFKQVC